MSVEKLEKMLADASDVAKWWKTNRETIETSWKRKAKREQRLHTWMTYLGCFATFSYLFTLIMAGTTNTLPFIVLCSATIINLLVFLGVAGAKTVIEGRCPASISQHHQEAVNRWGLDLNSQDGDKTLSSQHHAKMVAQLNELGIDPHHIVVLRNLDLPNTWWCALNEEIVDTHHEKQQQPQVAPTLEEVFVRVEQRTEAAKNHVLRL